MRLIKLSWKYVCLLSSRISFKLNYCRDGLNKHVLRTVTRCIFVPQHWLHCHCCFGLEQECTFQAILIQLWIPLVGQQTQELPCRSAPCAAWWYWAFSPRHQRRVHPSEPSKHTPSMDIIASPTLSHSKSGPTALNWLLYRYRRHLQASKCYSPISFFFFLPPFSFPKHYPQCFCHYHEHEATYH